VRHESITNVLGVLAIAFYATHGTYHLTRGFPENLLWCCHLGALLVGLGLLSRRATLNGVGLCWLAIGTPLWLIGLACGGTFVATSVLTHLGGLAIGVWGARRLGMPRGVWWKAAVGMVLLHLLTRPVNPPGKNINFAGDTWTGFEEWIPSHFVFLVLVLAGCSGVFLVLERVLGPGAEASTGPT
jgi:hypothetical protein